MTSAGAGVAVLLRAGCLRELVGQNPLGTCWEEEEGSWGPGRTCMKGGMCVQGLMPPWAFPSLGERQERKSKQPLKRLLSFSPVVLGRSHAPPVLTAPSCSPGSSCCPAPGSGPPSRVPSHSDKLQRCFGLAELCFFVFRRGIIK